ncbi:MAG: FtsX-like permease family protein [Planctomycetota bacterium]|nr:MAG: FtsX-like permease family protein [Planctomycetota bacterium]
MTFLLETIRLGLANLRLQMLRSILTALGIIFGVSAVITMVAIGEGSTAEALAQIERLGARNIIIRSEQPPESPNQQGGQQRSRMLKYGLTREDLRVIQENFPDASSVVPLKEVGSQLLRGSIAQTSQTFGTTPDLARVARLTVDRGRYLTQTDLNSDALVAVIGSDVAKDLFPLEDPIGKTFRVDEFVLEVIGVLAPVGLSGGAGAALVGRDLNKDVHIPITTAQAVMGDTIVRRSSGSFSMTEVEVHEIYLEAPTRERVVTDALRVRRILSTRHPEMKDVGMIVPYELLEAARKRAMTGQWISGAIAGISLLVGGIGIMNIMLANVTERTREIGIRRALGATRKHIVAQFLVETSVLSAIGGLIGVALGVGLSLSIGWLVPQLHQLPFIGDSVPADASLPTVLSLWSIVVAFLVAAATGLIFGLYPARKAALQDPIVALRHD